MGGGVRDPGKFGQRPPLSRGIKYTESERADCKTQSPHSVIVAAVIQPASNKKVCSGWNCPTVLISEDLTGILTWQKLHLEVCVLTTLQVCSLLNKSHGGRAAQQSDEEWLNISSVCTSAVLFSREEQTRSCTNTHTWLHVIEYRACLDVDPNHAFVLAHRIDCSYSILFHVCLCLI